MLEQNTRSAVEEPPSSAPGLRTSLQPLHHTEGVLAGGSWMSQEPMHEIFVC